MRYGLLMLMLVPLSGCVAFDEPPCFEGYNACPGPGLAGTVEPPTIVPAAATAPVQTREPPR